MILRDRNLPCHSPWEEQGREVLHFFLVVTSQHSAFSKAFKKPFQSADELATVKKKCKTSSSLPSEGNKKKPSQFKDL